jgi:uncharacterized protein YcnI
MKTVSRLAAMTAALVVLPAAAAWAHPALNPNQLPTGATTDSVLVVPHGCAPGGGMPNGGEALPTVLFSLAKTDGVTVTPKPVDGWDLAEDTEAVTWTATDGGTTDVIEFPVSVTVDTPAGEDVYVDAFQECEGGDSFRWIARPGDEGWPAVLVSATSGAVGTAAPDDDHMGMDMSGSEMPAADMPPDGMAADMAAEDMGPDTADAATQPLADEEADGGVNAGVVVAILAVLALLAGGLVAVARGRKAA